MIARSRASLVSLATLSALGVLTTWVALLSWRGFVELSGHFLGPLLVLGLVLVVTGTLARWWRAPAPVVVLAQLVTTGVGTSLFLTGSPLPVGSSWAELLTTFSEAFDSANQFAPPVPEEVPSVDPILIVGGLGCMLLVDLMACTLRRIPLAGLPLLTIFSVPLSMLGSGPSWYVFALTAIGFLAMLFVHEDEQVSRWGRSLERETGGGDADAFGVRTGAVRANAGAIGGVVTALAIVVPLAIPTLDLQVFDFGPGRGGDGDINIDNPMVDLRRDLIRGADKDLLEVVTDDPAPEYLRIAVLNRFSEEAWSSGDRDVPSSQGASGPMPSLEGVDPAIPRTEYAYGISATDEFRSRWLPTQSDVADIDAPGDWRYDVDTRDFLASDDDLDTRELSWDFTSVELELDANELAFAPSSAGLVSDEFTDLPEIDPEIRTLTLEVTKDAPSRFEKAVALQNWFRRGGGFTYDDSAVRENGADDLAAFLTEGPGGRTGYCEQFAASMAVMARILGIPARVAVGFLRPEQTGPETFVYSAHDLHAWPELYITGAGWVRFEPTPGGRAETVPGYTTQRITEPTEDPTTNPSEENIANPDRLDSAAPSPEARDEDVVGSESGSDIPWVPLLLVLLVVGLVLLVVLTPRALRRRRRAARLAGGPEDTWLELRDTVRDLGMPWPRERSPRQTADVLVGWFGLPPDEFTPERPRRGPDVNPDAVDALDRIVLALELARYAERGPGARGSWSADTETCILALVGGTTLRVRRRAEWWPRSLFVRERVVTRRDPDDDESQRPAYAGVVDHVG